MEQLNKEEMKLTERDILISACGEDEDGHSKSVVSVKMSEINSKTGEEKVIDELVLKTPIVNIFRSIKYTMIDLTYMWPSDFEFVNLFGRLQEFSKTDALNPDMDVMQTIVVTVSPKEYIGEFYLTGLHGAWSMQPSKSGAKIDTVRFIFDNEFFNVFAIDTGEEEQEEVLSWIEESETEK